MGGFIKICGVSTSEAIQVASDEGATHIGFIFFGGSPRYVTPKTAKNLRQGVHPKIVAVTVDADSQTTKEIVEVVEPDALQLHGNESVEEINQTKKMFGGEIIKAVQLKTEEDVEKIQKYEEVADMILLDAKPPQDSKLPGGNAVCFDWEIVRNLNTNIPAILSGGINMGNLNDAIEVVNDKRNSIIGIDVSSGVEKDYGIKDQNKIKELLGVCREQM